MCISHSFPLTCYSSESGWDYKNCLIKGVSPHFFLVSYILHYDHMVILVLVLHKGLVLRARVNHSCSCQLAYHLVREWCLERGKISV